MATLRHLQTRITVTGSNIIPNWYGDQLQLTGSSAVEVGQDPPSGASQGSLWWDTDDGNLFLYYEYVSESVSQSAWVPAVSLEVENPVAELAISASFAITASYIDVTGSNVLVNWFGSQLQLTGSDGAAVTVNDMPPSTPDQGQLWWDTDSGNLFVNYEFVDGGVSQSAWVPATSLEVQTMNATSSSYSATASYVDIKGDGIVVNYSGDEIQLTGSAALAFPYTGSAEITGSLILTGSISSNALFNAQSVMIGDGTDGSYRFNLTDGKLLVEKNILGIWNTSSVFF
jgi:hypothetical protein